MNEEQIKNLEIAIRNLVSSIYNTCHGAYGALGGYEGEFENEIQDVIKAIK